VHSPGGTQIVQQQIAHLVDDQNLRCRMNSHAEMRIADGGRAQKHYITGFVNGPQRASFTDLPLVDGRLEAKLELVEGFRRPNNREIDDWFGLKIPPGIGTPEFSFGAL
jgi:hypothetical protein